VATFKLQLLRMNYSQSVMDNTHYDLAKDTVKPDTTIPQK